MPDYVNNRLHVWLNYSGSAIFFGDDQCTLAQVRGFHQFTSDINTRNETMKMLETSDVGLYILWKAKIGGALDWFR